MSELTWVDESRVDRLKELYALGYSCNWIAAELGNGISRNAVIGKVHRLKLGLRGAGRHSSNEKRTGEPRALPRTRAAKADTSGSAPFRPRVVISPAVEHELRCVEIVPRNLSLLDLEPNDCRYPYGHCGQGEGIVFCGHPKIAGGSSYCPAHFVLTRQEPRTRLALHPRLPINMADGITGRSVFA